MNTKRNFVFIFSISNEGSRSVQFKSGVDTEERPAKKREHARADLYSKDTSSSPLAPGTCTQRINEGHAGIASSRAPLDFVSS